MQRRSSARSAARSRRDAIEDGVREVRLARWKQLVLLEAHVIFQERGKRLQRARVASLRALQVSRHRPVLGQYAIRQLHVPRVPQGGEQDLFLDGEVRSEL